MTPSNNVVVKSDPTPSRLAQWASYFRFRLFQALLHPFSEWARSKRMRTMMRLVNVRESAAILDIGGAPGIWNHDFLPRLTITILNLPGAIEQSCNSRHNFAYTEGDGCDVQGVPDKGFDFVFSNSVIEHVGGADRRAKFAAEVRRLGTSYWVQTPCRYFPIEAHTGMPFWWYYPNILRKLIIDGWRRKLPAWTDMVEGTTVISKQELRRLFPDAEILTERLLGIPKSYIALRV